MARAHLFRPVTDEYGNLLYGATVTVRRADLATSITQPIYDGPWSGAGEVDNPMIIPGGFVDIWLDVPERVNLLIQSVGRNDISIFLDVPAPAEEVVRSSSPLRITNAPAAGTILTGVDETSASWQPIPPPPADSVPVHWHPGDGQNSVALGNDAVASAQYSTAVGDGSQATGVGATAFGQDAQATFGGATAFGGSARAVADYTSAVGYQASASDVGAVAVGAQSLASGTQAVATGISAEAMGPDTTALGAYATAVGDGSVAVGANSEATGLGALALGRRARALHDHSVALGDDVVTTADGQVVLGAATQTVLVAGNADITGDVTLGGEAALVGFFGAAPVARQAVTGSDGGDLTLRALLGLLHDMGLIDNQSTQG